jgi:hypothetical protein
MPYGSARDLPTVVKMEEQLRALGVLTILSSKKRREVQRLREQLHRTVSTVDTFTPY